MIWFTTFNLDPIRFSNTAELICFWASNQLTLCLKYFKLDNTDHTGTLKGIAYELEEADYCAHLEVTVVDQPVQVGC